MATIRTGRPDCSAREKFGRPATREGRACVTAQAASGATRSRCSCVSPGATTGNPANAARTKTTDKRSQLFIRDPEKDVELAVPRAHVNPAARQTPARLFDDLAGSSGG